MSSLPLDGSHLGGWIDGKQHRFPLRVYYADTDAGGIVYHAAYLTFAERARTEMMRLVGLHQAKLREEQGLMFAVRHCEIDFLRPAQLDDLLEVRSTLTHLGGASMHIRQAVMRDEETLVTAHIRLVCITEDMRAARIPPSLRPIFQDFLTQEAD